jgi:hypothetical protein
MNKILIPTLALGLALVSCNGSKSETESPRQRTESTTPNVESVSHPARPVEDQPTTSDGSEWDQTLDQYESFIDKYIVLLKKSTSGDQSVTNEYLEMAEKAEALGKQLERSQDQLTREQMKRLVELQSKMSKAIIDLAPTTY